MDQNKKPVVVISGVNLIEGGTLAVMRDAITTFNTNFSSQYKLVLIIYNKELYKNLLADDTDVFEFRYPKKSWFLRIWFEYVHLYFLSKKINAHFWFSLHDITPNVRCKFQAVYCHNPTPFYKLSLKEAWLNKWLIIFRFFYSFFYRINIHRNKFVIVQQDWLRKLFIQKYKVKNVVVAYPDISIRPTIKNNFEGNLIFFYPSLPRAYKNFEVLLEAAKKLTRQAKNFEVIITIDGDENKYTKHLKKKYSLISEIKFAGRLTREDVFNIYAKNTCLVFPSKLETWGLPITEMKSFHKPILAADCEYAYETIGNYDKVCFFKPDDANRLSTLMYEAINNTIAYDKTNYTQPVQPLTKNWKELFTLLLN